MAQKIILPITDADILDFFWLANEEGYANPAIKAIESPFNPNEKTITIQMNDLVYQDKYWVTPASDCSAGTTTILYKHNNGWVPIWWMSYAGRYRKKDIPFLKKVLLVNIREKRFVGGRGPERYKEEFRSYSNNCLGSFGDFRGIETIKCFEEPKRENTERWIIVGHHRYQGMSLLP